MNLQNRQEVIIMANSLYNSIGDSNNMPFNIQAITDRLNQFRQSFSGDPKQQVQQLLNSGRMSQSQYNQLSQMATKIQKMLMNK